MPLNKPNFSKIAKNSVKWQNWRSVSFERPNHTEPQLYNSFKQYRSFLIWSHNCIWPILLNIVIHWSQELMLRHRLEKKIQNSGLSGGFTSHYVSYRRSSKKAFQRNTFRILAFWIVTLSELEESYLVLTKLNYSMCECRREQLIFAKDCQIFSQSVQLSYFKKVWRIAKKNLGVFARVLLRVKARNQSLINEIVTPKLLLCHKIQSKSDNLEQKN